MPEQVSIKSNDINRCAKCLRQIHPFSSSSSSLNPSLSHDCKINSEKEIKPHTDQVNVLTTRQWLFRLVILLILLKWFYFIVKFKCSRFRHANDQSLSGSENGPFIYRDNRCDNWCKCSKKLELFLHSASKQGLHLLLHLTKCSLFVAALTSDMRKRNIC